MSWEREGLIFAPDGRYEWLHSHAAVPIADPLEGSLVRVYFSSRDRSNRSHVGFFEIDLTNPGSILRLSDRPALSPGPLGAFDEDGVTGCWIVDCGHQKLLYYTGWNRGVSVPFRNAIGLAVSEDGGETFFRHAAGPVMDREIHDPYFVATPSVILDQGLWRMWYATGVKWEMEEAGTPKHYYHVAYADSKDGIHWRRDGTVCVGFQSDDEYVVSRPSVMRSGDAYRMWYSHRGPSYKIGYAESADGIRWDRKDSLGGLEPASRGWDSEMVEYAFVFDRLDRRWMLYNGNGYGRTGIGLAWCRGG